MDQQHRAQTHNSAILEKKRQRALQMHRARREQIFNLSRQMLALDTEQNSTPETLMEHADKGEAAKNCKNTRLVRFAKLFQVQDWMSSVPEDLINFYGAARPSGKRSLLIFNKGRVTLVDKAGQASTLCPSTKKNYEGTILEAIYVSEIKTAFVMDMLSWKGSIFTAQAFQFRINWLSANLASLKIPQVSLSLVSYLPLNLPNLKTLYQKNYGYSKQGLLFVHKDSLYVHEVNSNTLIWKDQFTSKYPIDLNDMGDQDVYGIGKIDKGGNVRSEDGFLLGKLPPQNKLRGFVRVRISGIRLKQEEEIEDEVEVSGFSLVEGKGFSRCQADPISRFIYQFQMRRHPLSIQEIAEHLQPAQ